jgi:PAS domain S-box-containing protein
MDELLDSVPCGYLSFNDEGKIIRANRTFETILGYEPASLAGLPIDKILPVASRIFYQTHLFPLLKLKEQADEVYLTVRSKSGESLPVLMNAVRRERDGAFVNDCIFVQMKQRSEYEDAILKAKKEAEAATRTKDEFLAMVSHELRTPLSSIIGWTRMLRSGQLDEVQVQKALNALERGTGSLERLIEDLLDFSRIIAGRMRISVDRVDVETVLEAALEIVKPAADAKEIRIVTMLDADAGPVSGDPERLQQVLWNLFSNAVKFTPKGGRIQVRMTRANSSVEITVSDTGKGIKPEFLPYVFDRFRQDDSPYTRRHGGLGLGMAITKHLVELHGGTIKADSPGEGQGATFTVRLPVMIVHAAAPFRSSSANGASVNGDGRRLPELSGLDGLRILIVEDDGDARSMLTSVLEHSGASVMAASTIAEGFEKARSGRPDLVISDIELSDGDGYSLIRDIRSHPDPGIASIPAITLTAHARQADRVKALAAGFQMHLAKPVEPVELVLAIANLTPGKSGPTT